MASRGIAPWAGVLVLAFSLATTASAQSQGAAPERGLRHVDPRWHAVMHADVVTEPGQRLEDATVVMRDGVIVSVQAGGPAPAGARVWDATGLTVYAGLIDAFVPVDVPGPHAGDPAVSWNPMITPQRSALDGPGLDSETRKALRKLGFGVAALAPNKGIVRGTSAVVLISAAGDELETPVPAVLAEGVHQVVAFDRAAFSWDRQRGARSSGYPMSQMGAVATLRQALSDADWYARTWEVFSEHPQGLATPTVDDAHAAFSADGPPLLFEADDELQLLRAAKLAREYQRELVLVGNGTEFRRLSPLAKLGLPMIVPLNFPEAPEVGTLAESRGVSLRALMAWEQAPTNVRRLADAGLELALTSSRTKQRSDFYSRLHRALQHGLDGDAALAMLTTTPAAMLGLQDRVGRVAPGMLANLVVVDGDLLVKQPKIRDVWVGGRRFVVSVPKAPDHKGTWSASFASVGEQRDMPSEMHIKGSKKVSLEWLGETLKARDVSVKADRLSLLLDGDEAELPGTWRLTGFIDGTSLTGLVTAPDGVTSTWSAEFKGELEASSDDDEAGDDSDSDDDADADEEDEEESEDEDASEDDAEDDDDEDGEDDDVVAADVPETYGLPFGAYGFLELPPAENVLVRGATIWTSGPEGIIEDGDLLVRDGKVAYVGPRREGLEARADRLVEAEGLHVTPGLIDCHSHTGVSGQVNEAGQRVTAEVSIADVIDPDDIGWYRQLAGGLTAANQLHGSANAIGGQNSVVKLRWGVGHPQDMLLRGARPGIKFALGENPKRVSQNTGIADEYPQTRMGVATLIRDRLLAGRDHRAAHAAYAGLSSREQRQTLPPRVDFELQALGEVVAGERLVHSHSYRQDEILMLCRLADELGFTIGTFQHVLEGYKVAEKIKASALGGSTFSDWWAYKYEVVDAIPHNAALMTQVGVVTSINSDSADHARRLNTEAAKSMKYGGLSAEQALKLVTLNPAIQLAIDDRTGSLEQGKQADFVVWTGDPLSYASKPASTWVDGRELFSLERDAALQAAATSERARLVQKLLAKKKSKKESKQKSDADKDEREQHEQDEQDRLWDVWQGGPQAGQPGECGCYEGVNR